MKNDALNRTNIVRMIPLDSLASPSKDSTKLEANLGGDDFLSALVTGSENLQ